MAEDGGEIDDDSEDDETYSGPEGEAGGVSRKMRLGGVDLAEKEAEAADSESDSHEAEAGANPGEEGSLGGEVDSRVLFGGLFHVGIVTAGNREQGIGSSQRGFDLIACGFSWLGGSGLLR